MKTIKIILERNKDAFWAYAENAPMVTGSGDSIMACKQGVLDAIESLKTLDKESRPSFLNAPFSLRYQIDTQSFLEYYGKVFSRAALSRLTGINEKQLGHYIQGVHKPRKDKAQKIEKALHGLGEELLSLELV